jgi:hypothetical protein
MKLKFSKFAVHGWFLAQLASVCKFFRLCRVTSRMICKLWTRSNVGRSGSVLLLAQYLPGKTEEDHEDPQDGECEAGVVPTRPRRLVSKRIFVQCHFLIALHLKSAIFLSPLCLFTENVLSRDSLITIFLIKWKHFRIKYMKWESWN